MLDKDYAIQLAMEYGFTGGFDAEGNLTFDAEFVEAVLEAIADEREACAEILDGMAFEMESDYEPSYAVDFVRENASKIRARGEAL